MPRKSELILAKRRRASHPAKRVKGKPEPRIRSEKAVTAAERKAHGSDFEALFFDNPQPLCVLDRETLRILEANAAATRHYGYSRPEFLAMNAGGLLPAGGADRFLKDFQSRKTTRTAQGRCQHRSKNGQTLEVDIAAQQISFRGRRAILMAVREVSGWNAQRQAEERFRHLFENAVEGIFQSTVAGRYISANPALARMYGYSSPAELMESVEDIAKAIYVDSGRREQFQRLIEQRGSVEAFECQVRRKDGAKIWVSASVRAIRGKDGGIEAYEGTVEDITDRKRSELERQVSTEIFQTINVTDNLDELLRSIHAALKQVLCAENCFVALYESSAGTFQFPFFVDQLCAAPEPRMACRAAYVYRTGKAMLIPREKYRLLVEHGEVKPVANPALSWLGVPLRGGAGPIGVLVVKHYEQENAYTERDLEFLSSIGDQIAFAIERKRAEGRIRESEARLRVLIEQLPAVLWTVDKDLRFTSVLGAGLARLGLKPNQIAGMLLPEYFETSDPTFLPVAAHRRAVNGEPTTFHVEWKDGSYACHAEPLRGLNGEVMGAICMALDITDRKQLEERFRQAQKMEAVGRLAGGIAHDFNNLLMVIQGYADLLAEKFPVGDSLRRNAEQIQMAAQRATSLTQQLLAFSRKQLLAPKVLNIHGVVADMEKILRRLIGEDIELETSSERDLWLVKADRSQIEQVIMNLAVNARDAMPHGGRLAIETANVDLDDSFSNTPPVLASGKYVMLAVTDNGSGMDDATQAHIFEPFFTTKEKGKGTGLGLATVYGIVKQSGGYIWVYSEPDHGTTFKIYLPRIEQEEAGTARERPEARSLPRGSGMVLLVEDEKGVRKLAREYLEMVGYGVIEAEDGHTALELASMHDGPIHLLMTDVVMPGIGGRELSERVAQIRPGIKVLYMSGYADQSVVHNGVMDADAVLLQKPFTLATLASKLREILAAETVVQ